MSKKSRRAAWSATATVDRPSPAVLDAAQIPVVGGREACPCGSGKRYKLCHGRASREAGKALVSRPFEGLPGECDWVALREIVPAATATARTAPAHGGQDVAVTTVLPMAWAAMRRADGTVHLGLQTMTSSPDPSRDLAAALLAALDADPGTPVVGEPPTGPGPRLQDMLDLSAPFDVSVHQGFDFWLDGVGEITPDVRESMERANAAAVPTQRLTSVEAAYWCRIGERYHLRWVFAHPEDQLLDALARLHADRASAVAEGARYVGAFRAHGLLVPVWDLAEGTEASALEEPAAAFELRLGEAMARTSPLTADERRARAGMTSRQLTLR